LKYIIATYVILMLVSLLKLLFECFMLYHVKDRTFYFANKDIDVVMYTSDKFKDSSFIILCSNLKASSVGPISFKQALRYIKQGKWQPNPLHFIGRKTNPNLSPSLRLENKKYLFSSKRFAYYLDLNTNKIFTYNVREEYFKYAFLFKDDDKFNDYTLTQEQKLWTAPDRIFLI